jgi:HD superfamily phosphohydrolase YqeK
MRAEGDIAVAIIIDDAGLQELFPEIAEISDDTLRRGVLAIWKEIGAECAWDKFEDIPKNIGSESGRRLVDHVRGVTVMALSLAEIARKLHGTPYNRDHLLAACLLHDVSKPVESEPDPGKKPPNDKVLAARKSALGAKIQHAGYATHKISAHKLPLDVAHLVLTHTHASNLRANTIEASYLFFADYADSDAGIEPTGDVKFAHRVRFVE